MLPPTTRLTRVNSLWESEASFTRVPSNAGASTRSRRSAAWGDWSQILDPWRVPSAAGAITLARHSPTSAIPRAEPEPRRGGKRENRERNQRQSEERQVDVAVEPARDVIRGAAGEERPRRLPVDREVVSVPELLPDGDRPQREEERARGEKRQH